MFIDAEAGGHAVWASEHDQRVTRMGRFMRAVHLDELPQVLNILRGEMSLIGPRPEREEFAMGLEEMIPSYRRRLDVKPGLTGWAQVKYRYTRTDQEALIKLQYDLYYIKHQSFRLDILIILKTVIEVLAHHGT
jgi:lipopolysaccharide/colanic/teichoic acid biosynthesis glycosyltransferase